MPYIGGPGRYNGKWAWWIPLVAFGLVFGPRLVVELIQVIW